MLENRDIGGLLGLTSPWEVKDVKVSDDLVRVDVIVGTESGRMLECPGCGKLCGVHDRVRRMWRHLDIMSAECYVTADIPRTKCGSCGILQLRTPWAREYVSYTNEFEKKALGLLRSMPISRAAAEMGVDRSVIEGMMKHCVENILNGMDLSGVRRIMIDETSSKRGRRYITVITDADNGRIIFMAEGRGSDTLEKFSDWLTARGGDPRRIRWVSSDLSASFISGIEAQLPMADIVYDPFHLVQTANKAMDDIRSKNQANGRRDKNIRFALLRNSGNLSEKDKAAIFNIRRDNAVIGKAYEMKESLIQLYDYPDISSAAEHIRSWLDWVGEEGEPRMKQLARTVSEHRNKILNWYSSRMSNGFLEGLNGMIQTTKRMARGYRNIGNFITMIYFRHGRSGV